MAEPSDVRPFSIAVLAAIGGILFLRFAQDVFIPLVIGVLISRALEPIVSWMKQWWIPRALGAGLVLAALLGAAGFGIYNLSDDAVLFLDKVPAAARKIRQTLKVSQREGGGLMEKVQEAATEVENTAEMAAGTTTVPKGVTRVQVEEKPFVVGDYLWRGGAGILVVAGETVLVVFLVYFLLITGDLFKRKMIKIAGSFASRSQITFEISEEIDRQIARYVLVQLSTSLLVGVVSGLVFWWVGLEQAIIWGLAAGLCNTIPYFGPVIVSTGIFTIGYLQFGTILMALYLLGLSLLITSLEGFLLTPWLTGRAVHMNGVAVFLGLMFWGWLWGVWGLLLAVPMLVVLKTICDRIDNLKPIGELLGD